MKYGTCYECGEHERLAQINDEDLWVCEDCFGAYKKCEDCEEYAHEDAAERDIEGRYICIDCIDEVYKECTACEEYTCDYMDDDNSDPYCEGCKSDGQGYWEEHYRALEGDMKYEMMRDENL